MPVISRERPEQAPCPSKAYKNHEFLNGPHARMMRIICEFEEPKARLEKEGVENIVMIFGSARSKNPETYKQALADAQEKVKTDPKTQPQLTRLLRMEFLCRYHNETVRLAGLITKFSAERAKKGLPMYHVGTGAGPGMMEAASEGAWREGGKCVGFGISLPFETGLNPYVTPELGFEFHYFFTRKFWMAYKCMGLVVAPGGYGTCDELFEILTLIKTGKIPKRLPVILFGAQYWSDVLDMNYVVKAGLAKMEESNLLYTCDTADEAFERLKSFWLSQEAEALAANPIKVNGNGASPAMHEAAQAQALKTQRASAPTPERPMPMKAYKNIDFIKSDSSRAFRIQCEFEETRLRLEANNIANTLLFVGSGKVKSPMEHVAALSAAARAGGEDCRKQMELLASHESLLKFHQVSKDIARSITTWSMQRRDAGKPSFHVATSGGFGLAGSANEGAWEAGGKSIAFSGRGFFNSYVTPELAFNFHYFFTRKFWMAYKCMGLVALPGGYGTMDTLFEVLTLMQTGKMKQKIPVVLIGVDYWKSAIQWQKMADYGMISDQDVSQLLFTDSADEAFAHIRNFWEDIETSGGVLSPKRRKITVQTSA
eukprot:TRINITY_DN29161_c0_g2_i1.p1 TRINITY_DN29161_c0_g2~~TRINITY_DN29161_c0_g2_i1.p1  ORF type:complete len:599 (-),score=136.03 TRINITY_DN29161_c0_g2_i1:266-2062(-)